MRDLLSSFVTGIPRPRVQEEAGLHRRAGLHLQAVSPKPLLVEGELEGEDLFTITFFCLDLRGDPLPTVEYTAEERATWSAACLSLCFSLCLSVAPEHTLGRLPHVAALL